MLLGPRFLAGTPFAVNVGFDIFEVLAPLQPNF